MLRAAHSRQMWREKTNPLQSSQGKPNATHLSFPRRRESTHRIRHSCLRGNDGWSVTNQATQKSSWRGNSQRRPEVSNLRTRQSARGADIDSD